MVDREGDREEVSDRVGEGAGEVMTERVASGEAFIKELICCNDSEGQGVDRERHTHRECLVA